MKIRGSLFVGTVVATFLTPLAALAAGTVTTSPFGAAAPAVGMPMLVLLALALSFGAMYVLRRKAANATVRLAVVATAALLAGIAYATMPSVMVSGDQCRMRTTQTWDSGYATMLENQCSNTLLIEAIDPGCDHLDAPSLPACVPGQPLAADTACYLPECIF